MEPFKFRPFQPKVSKSPMLRKCCICGEEKAVNEMAYTGQLMESPRDQTKYACQSHL